MMVGLAVTVALAVAYSIFSALLKRIGRNKPAQLDVPVIQLDPPNPT